MATLFIYNKPIPDENRRLTAPADIADYLRARGVHFEQWQADKPLAVDADPETIMAAYAEVERAVTILSPDRKSAVSLF